jgi:hypothetical protein
MAGAAGEKRASRKDDATLVTRSARAWWDRRRQRSELRQLTPLIAETVHDLHRLTAVSVKADVDWDARGTAELPYRGPGADGSLAAGIEELLWDRRNVRRVLEAA